MSLRARIFVIVSILVLFILGISIFLVINKNKPAPSTQDDQTATAPNGGASVPDSSSVATSIPEGLRAKIVTPVEAEKKGVEQLAKVFVERYSTYSTDNDWQNIKDVETLVTRSLWSKISASITAKNPNQSFVGMTTKVISMELLNWSDTKAKVELKTSRTEEKNGVVTTRYQSITVELVKVKDLWLVDKLLWN